MRMAVVAATMLITAGMETGKTTAAAVSARGFGGATTSPQKSGRVVQSARNTFVLVVISCTLATAVATSWPG